MIINEIAATIFLIMLFMFLVIAITLFVTLTVIVISECLYKILKSRKKVKK